MTNIEKPISERIYEVAVEIQKQLQDIPECEFLFSEAIAHDDFNSSFYWSQITFVYSPHKYKDDVMPEKFYIQADQDVDYNPEALHFDNVDYDNYEKLKTMNYLLDDIIESINTNGANARIFISQNIIEINTGSTQSPIFSLLQEKELLKREKNYEIKR